MLALTVYTPDALTAADRIAAALEKLTSAISQLEKTMSAEMQALVAQVSATTAVEASAVTLIQGIVAQLEAAAGDKAKVLELTQQLKDGTQPLADAVAQNTVPPAPQS